MSLNDPRWGRKARRMILREGNEIKEPPKETDEDEKS